VRRAAHHVGPAVEVVVEEEEAELEQQLAGRTDALGNPILTGYGREMTYDQRFMTNTAPPFFPLTVQYTALRWPRMTTDALYDRPTWRELLGP
jgi:hypothetical protein